MDIDKLTIGEAKQLAALFGGISNSKPHLMLNRRCLVRTRTAGVHIGDISHIDGEDCKLENALRLWSWKDGGLSLSVIASKGVKSARLNRTGEIYLTDAIELIPTTAEAEATYARFIEE
jgi:hypothetical protein